MQIDDLGLVSDSDNLTVDLIIIGSGPVGLTIARELFGLSLRIIVLESGVLQENDAHNDLLTVESVADPKGDLVAARRRAFHGTGAKFWNQADQSYGLRCRVFGGSSHAWAGKSALFDPIDFDQRSWVENSGWPISRDELLPMFDRAAKHLNLGPNVYDASLFSLIGQSPSKKPNPEILSSFFWQFARSRRDKMDIMRFGPDFAAENARNVRVIINATATHINLSTENENFDSLEVTTLQGRRRLIKAERCIIAAGAIENARLLLASNRQFPEGIGNQRDQVGRYLMDHPGVRLGWVPKAAASTVVKTFGFYGVRGKSDVHMYQHGVRLSETLQRALKLLNCSAYLLEDRAPDDPWDAAKRLVRGNGRSWISDIISIAKSPGFIIKGIAVKFLQSPLVSDRIKSTVINLALNLSPGLAASEFSSRGLPHKLSGLFIDGIVEQAPRPENRITLSSQSDRLGMPRALVRWKIHNDERQTLLHLGRSIAKEFLEMGLPQPEMEDWVTSGRPEAAAIIDMGHTSGTTRMSISPDHGVVDINCQVHGVGGLFVAGSSVFPTVGHANPTLMAVALAVRLADHIKNPLTCRPD